MQRRYWILSVIGWDSCLPLLVVLAQELLHVTMSEQDLAELIAVGAIPLVAALVRAHHGAQQLKKWHGRAPLGRQCLFALAILLLLYFEAMTGILLCDPHAPQGGWPIIAAGYLIYLALIMVALRPSRSTTGDDQLTPNQAASEFFPFETRDH